KVSARQFSFIMARPMTNRELSEFLLRACHDLRTPLRGIRAHSELLVKDANAVPPADLPQPLGFITRGAKRMDLLVECLAAYGVALQTDPGTFQSAKMDVLLRAVLAKLSAPIHEAGAEVTYDELPRVQGNPDRLMNLLEQLIRNALDHRGTEP